MFTGEPPKVHGMRSNVAPSLGVKCQSVLESLRESGLNGRVVGIAHLVDAFGGDVETVTAVTHCDESGDALVGGDKAVMESDVPGLLALQPLSVDQTSHARGSSYSEDLATIEAAAKDVYPRFNAIFHLADARYMGNVYDDVEAGKGPGAHQVEVSVFYRSIQPKVAKVNSASIDAAVAYLEAEPDSVSTASRDVAQSALNGAASVILLA